MACWYCCRTFQSSQRTEPRWAHHRRVLALEDGQVARDAALGHLLVDDVGVCRGRSGADEAGSLPILTPSAGRRGTLLPGAGTPVSGQL